VAAVVGAVAADLAAAVVLVVLAAEVLEEAAQAATGSREMPTTVWKQKNRSRIL
jgi:hypothetical protein